MNFLQIPRVNSLLLVDVCTNYELNQSLIEVEYLVFSLANPASILDSCSPELTVTTPWKGCRVVLYGEQSHK